MPRVRRDINYDNVTSPDDVTDDESSSMNLVFILTIAVLSFLLVFVPLMRWLCQRYTCRKAEGGALCSVSCQRIEVATPIIVISGSEVTRRDNVIVPMPTHVPRLFASSLSLTSRDAGHYTARSCDCHSRCNIGNVTGDEYLYELSGAHFRRASFGCDRQPSPIRRPHSCSCIAPEAADEALRLRHYFQDYVSVASSQNVSPPAVALSHVTSSPLPRPCCLHCDSRPVTPVHTDVTSIRGRLHLARALSQELRHNAARSCTPDLLMLPTGPAYGGYVSRCQSPEEDYVLPGQSPRPVEQ